MNPIKKLGLVGLILVGSLLFPRCGEGTKEVILPNNYITSGEKWVSNLHKGSQNVLSTEENLVEKSRINGRISYLGLLKTEDQNILTGSDNKTEEEIIMKIQPENYKIAEYIMQIKVHGERISPLFVLEKFKEGEIISIPTIRKYDEDGLSGGNGNLYRMLNEVDYLYLHEIEK